MYVGVRTERDTRAVGRMESYSKHKDLKLVRVERRLKYMLWAAKAERLSLALFGALFYAAARILSCCPYNLAPYPEHAVLPSKLLRTPRRTLVIIGVRSIFSRVVL
jgi:hypothetical protein